MHANQRVAKQLALVAVGMLMLAYASVPLYRLFCQVTGFGGTTREARLAPYQGSPTDRTVTITFDANVDPKLPWKFEPLQRQINLRIGENKLVAFRVTNLSDQPTEGRATYNATPFSTASYINKVQCFCFERQALAPNQSATMPVAFFIDPTMLEDRNAAQVANITLSYTFFRYESAGK